MSDFIKQNTEATEQYMAFLAKAQEQILENAKQFPAAPEFPAAAAPEMPAHLTELPTPRELTQAAFSFTEKLIAQQRSFVEQYLDIAEKKTSEEAAKAAPKKK